MKLPRGMKDFDTTDNADIDYVRDCFKRVSELYGFLLMNPSPIELLSTLETKSGPGIRDEIYYFKDKGDREVALRFDFTMGLTRYVASQKSLRLPAKFSSFGGVFRYDEPQKGRYRYFHQWDLEIYGKPSLESDSEVIEATSRLFDLLLDDIIIDINHRGLVESYINHVFDSHNPELVADILRAVDKISKKSQSDILAEFEAKGYDKQKLQTILDFSSLRGDIPYIEAMFDTTKLEFWDYLKDLIKSLHNRNVSNVKINFGIVRGLDYYSGTVFEVFVANSNIGALAGGGRYDTLTAAFGRQDIGACGVAGGVERTILAMHEQGISTSSGIQQISVLYVNPEMQKFAAHITSLLRLQGIPADMDITGRSLKKQIAGVTTLDDNDYTSKATSAQPDNRYTRFALIVGPREIARGCVVLRNMQEGTESVISIIELTQDPYLVLNLEKP